MTRMDGLCTGHEGRFRKDRLTDLSAFIALQASDKPIGARRGPVRDDWFSPVQFDAVSEQFAHDLRYVAATKIRRNNWRKSEYTWQVLTAAIDLGVRFNLISLTDLTAVHIDQRRGEIANGSKSLTGTSGNRLRHLANTLPTLQSILKDGMVGLWQSETWYAPDLGLLAEGSSGGRIYWKSVSLLWLHDGLKALGKEQLQAGTRAFQTVQTYPRAGAAFSEFCQQEAGALSPSEVTRPVFLNFLAWVRDRTNKREDLNAVNHLRNLLELLRDNSFVPDLPDTTWLKRGENAINRVRQPKPFPKDIVDRIDAFIYDDALVAFGEEAAVGQMKLMLRVLRAVAPRSSELFVMKHEALQYVEGQGYRLEFWQTKIKDWRRVPIPENLGKDLAVVITAITDRTLGRCDLLFPVLGQNRLSALIRDEERTYEPWSYSAFTNEAFLLFKRIGADRSSLTGETLPGAQLHRFRHSIATGLLNEGWSQHEVQKFLGHRSATMVQAYAEIHDKTIHDKYIAYIGESVDINGRRHVGMSPETIQVERMRDKTRSQLADGFCTLPEKSDCDFVPSPCLTCPMFRTTPEFLPVHRRRLDGSLEELQLATSEGRDRAAESHRAAARKLTVIISGLEKLQSER